MSNIITTNENGEASIVPYTVSTGSVKLNGYGWLELPVSPNSGYNFNKENFTFEFFSKTQNSTVRPLLAIGPPDTPTNSAKGLILYKNQSNQFVLHSDTARPEWNHVAVTRQGTNIRVYVNGNQTDGSTIGASENCFAVDGGIGIGRHDIRRQYNFIGKVSNFRLIKNQALYTTSIFDVPDAPLTETGYGSTSQDITGEVKALLLKSSTVDSSLTVNGSVTMSSDNPWGTGVSYSAVLDGASDLVLPNTNNSLSMGTSDFTLEFWVNSDTVSNRFGLFTTSTTTNPYWHSLASSLCITLDQNYNLGVTRANTSGFYFPAMALSYLPRKGEPIYWHKNIVSPSVSVPSDTWEHVAVSRNEDSIRIYSQGNLVLCASVSARGFNGVISQVFGNVELGDSLKVGFQGDSYFGGYSSNGYFSNLRIIKGQGLYTSQTITVPNEALTDSGYGSISQNITGNVVLRALQDSTADDNSGLIPTGIVPQLSSRDADLFAFLYPYDLSVTSAYITIPVTRNLDMGSGVPFTMELWANSDVSDSTFLFAQENAKNTTWQGGNICSILFFESGVFAHQYLNNGYGGFTTITAPKPAPNVWHHYAVTVDSSNVTRVFVDGVLVGSSSTPRAQGNFQIFTLGRSFSPYKAGKVSNVRFIKGQALYTTNFNRPNATLTPTGYGNVNQNITGSVELLALTTPILDRSLEILNSGVGRVYDGPWTQKEGYSMSFEGQSSAILYDRSLALTANFTVEFWAKHASLPSGGTFQMYFCEQQNGLGLYMDSNRSLIVTHTGYSNIIITSPDVIIDLNWHHFALTRSANVIRLFVDGALVGSATSSQGFSNQPRCWFGTNYDLLMPFIGNLSNFRSISNQALYTSPFTPPDQPLTAYGYGNTSQNISGYVTFLGFNSKNPSKEGIFPYKNALVSTVDPWNQTDSGDYVSWSFLQDPNTFGINLGQTYVSLTNTSSLDFGTGEFTIEFWANVRETKFAYNRFFVLSTSNPAQSLLFNPGHASFSSSNYSLESNNLTTGGIVGSVMDYPLRYNVWNHFAVCRNNSTNKFEVFINGKKRGDIAVGNNKSIDVSTLHIGYFSGYLTNFRIIKGQALYTGDYLVPYAPLTYTGFGNQTQNITGSVRQLLLQSDVLDSNLSPTRVASTTTASTSAVYEYVDGYASFNSRDYLLGDPNVWNFSGGIDFTVEFWVKLNNTLTSGLIGKSLGGGNTPKAIIYVSSNKLIVGQNGSELVGTTTLEVGRWYHIAVTRQNGTIRSFINGAQERSSSSPYWTDTQYLSAPFQIGKLETLPFNGNMSNLRIIKNQSLYNNSFAPVGLPLTQTGYSSISQNITGDVSLLDLQGTGTTILSSANEPYYTNNELVFAIPIPSSVSHDYNLVDTSGGTGFNVWSNFNELTPTMLSYPYQTSSSSRTVLLGYVDVEINNSGEYYFIRDYNTVTSVSKRKTGTDHPTSVNSQAWTETILSKNKGIWVGSKLFAGRYTTARIAQDINNIPLSLDPLSGQTQYGHLYAPQSNGIISASTLFEGFYSHGYYRNGVKNNNWPTSVRKWITSQGLTTIQQAQENSSYYYHYSNSTTVDLANSPYGNDPLPLPDGNYYEINGGAIVSAAVSFTDFSGALNDCNGTPIPSLWLRESEPFIGAIVYENSFSFNSLPTSRVVGSMTFVVNNVRFYVINGTITDFDVCGETFTSLGGNLQDCSTTATHGNLWIKGTTTEVGTEVYTKSDRTFNRDYTQGYVVIGDTRFYYENGSIATAGSCYPADGTYIRDENVYATADNGTSYQVGIQQIVANGSGGERNGTFSPQTGGTVYYTVNVYTTLENASVARGTQDVIADGNGGFTTGSVVNTTGTIYTSNFIQITLNYINYYNGTTEYAQDYWGNITSTRYPAPVNTFIYSESSTDYFSDGNGGVYSLHWSTIIVSEGTDTEVCGDDPELDEYGNVVAHNYKYHSRSMTTYKDGNIVYGNWGTCA